MGWASLLEDVVKRFDAESGSALPTTVLRRSPSAASKAKRARLDREQVATQKAILAFQNNEQRIKRQGAEIVQLRKEVEQENEALNALKAKLSEIAKTNRQMNSRLAPLREKYANRSHLLISA